MQLGITKHTFWLRLHRMGTLALSSASQQPLTSDLPSCVQAGHMSCNADA